jgi:hypothetical protein
MRPNAAIASTTAIAPIPARSNALYFFSRRARNEPKKVAVPKKPKADATSALTPTDNEDLNITCPVARIEIKQYASVKGAAAPEQDRGRSDRG